MARDLTIDWLGRRYDPSAGKGHLESYFLRANHPTEPRAFWLKATIWAPIDGEAVAEAWCITFDRAGATWAAKTTAPFADSRFSEDALDIEIAGCRFRFGLDGGEASGRMKDGERRWDVRWTSVGGVLGSPVRYYSPRLLHSRLLSSKVVDPTPVVRFEGTMSWGEEQVDVGGWTGSMGHNWGRKQVYNTYAWAQCVFPAEGDEPESFMVGYTSDLLLGKVSTPSFSGMVVRRGDREYRFDRVFHFWTQHVTVRDMSWTVHLRGPDGDATAHAELDPSEAACLGYPNPDRTMLYCINSKLAEVTVRVNPVGERSFELRSAHGGALEFLRRTPDPRFPNPV